jgi:hypothetical protein
MHQDFSVYTKEPLCTADLLEAVHQYSMQDIHGSAHTPNSTSLSTREGQFHNLKRLCEADSIVNGVRALAQSETAQHPQCKERWAEAPIKIARMTLTIKLDGNWSSFQLANSAPPLSVTDSAIAPSARMVLQKRCDNWWHLRNICWCAAP